MLTTSWIWHATAGRQKQAFACTAGSIGQPCSLHRIVGPGPLYVGPGQYDVDPTVDPAVVSPINGGERRNVSFVTSVFIIQIASRECVI